MKLMKTMRKFLALAFVGMAFVACSNDDEPGDGGTGNGNENKEAWVSLGIKTTGGNTRELHNPSTDNGTANETKVNKVRAIFFDASLLVTEDKELTSAQAGLPAENNSIGGEAFTILPESKHVLIVVNPSSVFPTYPISASTPYSTVNAAITASIDNVIGASKADFMMTNAVGDLEPFDTSTKKPVALTSYKTAAAAESAPLRLYVDRVAAKARLYNDHDNATTSSAFNVDASSVKWALNVTNKKFFPASKRTVTANNTSVWSDRYGLGSYRVDPNYDDVAATQQPDYETALATYKDNYNYYAAGDVLTGSVSTSTTSNPLYCLENTQIAKYNFHAYTTHALVQANVYPKEFKKPDGTVETGTSDIDWLKIGNGYYIYNTLKEWIKAELEASKANGDKLLVSNHANAINSYFEGVATGTGVTWTDADDVDAIMLLFDAKNPATAGTFGSVTFHKGGISYYKIMIKHDNDDNKANNLLGEFGIVRNSVYDIHIGNFMSSGYPTIPEPDPNTPDEEDKDWLSIHIDINPWTWYTQTEDI
ncbi:Mfa1 family fimbria major subunit [Bacteroides sp. 519]|uniref:Mfa1 family fimbria major subunit n=1 Tax=Bacteroides sp. 519 TaxID=2302937 RepID=UPI0013D697C6|nr:Mfa1 family fimbria major subunit [Bacteroides sp. 519]NDV59194.1 hypothetical protein [Bacteroides sp. 519]